MSSIAVQVPPKRVVYPESDGKPMAENTIQYDWITKIKGGLGHLFAKDPNVFVAGDLFWYPIEGHPEIVMAPDVLVAFGRPKGDRGSYRQWEEGGIAPQVVFEVLSPSNRPAEMRSKFEFYRSYGVEEYYICDPDRNRVTLTGFLRKGNELVPVETIHGHVSPRLNVKFELAGKGLRIVGPDGKPFGTYEEVADHGAQAEQRAEAERLRAEEQRRLAESADARAERERMRAEQERMRAEQERVRADELQAELERLRRDAKS